MRAQILLLGAALACVLTGAHPEYPDRIPNGRNVKDVNGNEWLGVGHMRPQGGGARNPFGDDFANAGFQWTQALCRKDSDGDGATNGEELGDPNCVWTPNSTPESSTVSHPGFPGDVKSGMYDTCRGFVSPANATNMTIQFTSPYALPAGVVTTYPRQAFDLRTVPGSAGNVDHWAFRFETIYGGPVANVHHILLYSCTASEVADFLAQPITTGRMPCSKGLVFAWAIGGAPFCLPQNVAIRLKSSSPYVLMEVHMNNPTGTSGILSQPGFRITALPLNAPQPPMPIKTAHWLWLGTSLTSMSIPPGKLYVEITSTVDVPATPVFTATVLASISHMHYIGRKVWVEINSASGEDATAACNPLYDNGNQEVIPLNPTVEIKNGDKIVTHCVFNSTGKTTVTNGGEETDDEMCFVFLLFISDQINAPYEAITAGVTTYSPQRTSVLCEAASVEGFPVYASMVPPWLIAHAILGATGLGFLLPIAALFPASRKLRAKGSMWFKLHRGIMLLAVVMGIVGFALGINFGSSGISGSQHGKMGLTILIFIILQPLNGFLRPHLPSAGEAKTTARKAFEWVHPTFGWIIMGCVAVQIFWGYELLILYLPYLALDNWKWAHVCGGFSLWAVTMAFLHPPPCLRRSAPVNDGSTLALANKV